MQFIRSQKIVSKFLTCAALIFTVTSVNATIITFGDNNVDRLDLAGVQSENDFSYSAFGDGWELQDVFGNPGASLTTFFNRQGGDVGDEITFFNNNGDLFSFGSVDWRTINDSGTNDFVIFQGFLGGALVDSLVLDGANENFTNIAGFGGALDQLTLTITRDGRNALLIDNLNLTTVKVPESSMAMLFLIGLVTLLRRKF
ncbi:hypothetical protein [Agaribacter marinus]|uniref:PEP-CTERM protein-sorting domain-containing protein n=1 Tax=Agaribacter marinus TaxID=1431249 RepID=A0AA37WI61_9ALTE|nr:hypothetical protein [Agaribacter marinus]GLR70577.1 hypothetical protein GCM10007852_14850 [Agaribacter marinus]